MGNIEKQYDSYVERIPDAEFDRCKKRVNAIAKKWVKPLGLGYWTTHLNFLVEIVRDSGNAVGMVCDADWRYQEATITVNVRAVKDLTDGELEACFVHELMHIFLNEMRENGIEHEERVATQLQKAFLWAVENVER